MRKRKPIRKMRIAAISVFITLVACLPAVWENFSGTQYVEPEYVLQPSTADELVDIVKEAGKRGGRVRMTGSGHSHSDVAVTEDVLLVPYELNEVLSLDTSRLRPGAPGNLVRVMSGITLRDLNTYLDGQGLALENMGGYDAQTIVGAAMTGTHGSGLDYGPIASQIVSLQVIGEKGKVYQVEPSNGITNPASFSGRLEEDSSIRVTLIQDDDIFNSMTVSIGSMGVVYSVVIKTEPKFWLEEQRTLTTWSAVSAPDGFLDRVINRWPIDDGNGLQPDYYELQYNPYEVDGVRSCLITKRYKHATEPEGDNVRGEPGSDVLQGILVHLSPILGGIINAAPGLAPVLINQSLQSQSDPDGYVDVSYNVFNIGVVNETAALAVEIFVDLEEIVPVLERAFEIAEELQAQGWVHSGPASVRFVGASDQPIAMTHGADKAVVEIIVLADVNNHLDLMRYYEERLMEEFDGRLHWGLDLSVIQGSSRLAELYPRWNDWLSVYHTFNKGTFDGKVTDRLGISVKPR